MKFLTISPCEHGETRRHAYQCDCPEGKHRYIGCPTLTCAHALGAGLREYEVDGPVILLPDEGEGVRVARLADTFDLSVIPADFMGIGLWENLLASAREMAE